ncbi:hypothetical protein DFH09DRAFT_1069391 [Mycena vulgaris]|nr:hypothetical protein DFH09DRAFT_1069391 [Mycena vulgaris]
MEIGNSKESTPPSPLSPLPPLNLSLSQLPSREGMRRGYELSPMAELRHEYEERLQREPSLQERTTDIAHKSLLDIADVQDRGVSINPDNVLYRFALEKGCSLPTERAVMEMQSLLKRASDLIPERSSCFLVDPHQVLMIVLKGATELNEMTITWAALSRRVELAQRNFAKYESEYAALAEDELLKSPVSTDPGVYSVFPRGLTPMLQPGDRLATIPRAGSILPPPHRDPEERLWTVYYSAKGELKTINVSPRSSRGAGADFQVPPAPAKQRSVDRARCLHGDILPIEGGPSRISSQVPVQAGAPAPVKHWNLSDTGRGLLGSETPYKDTNEFFVPKFPRGSAAGTTDLTGKVIPSAKPLKGKARLLTSRPLTGEGVSTPNEQYWTKYQKRMSSPFRQLMKGKIRLLTGAVLNRDTILRPLLREENRRPPRVELAPLVNSLEQEGAATHPMTVEMTKELVVVEGLTLLVDRDRLLAEGQNVRHQDLLDPREAVAGEAEMVGAVTAAMRAKDLGDIDFCMWPPVHRTDP